MVKKMEFENIEFDELEQGICSAYLAGMSVCEITFVLNSASCEHTHDIIRKADYVNHAEYQPTLKLKIDPHFLYALRVKKYTFNRWCVGWMFDLKSTEREILEKREGKVKQAIKRDFPIYFKEVYGEPANQLFGKEDSFSFAHPTVEIRWDKDNKLYRAQYLEEPELFSVYATKISDAAIKFEEVFRTKKRLQFLEKAIKKYRANLEKGETPS